VPPQLVRDFDYLRLPEGQPDTFAHWASLLDNPDVFFTPRNGGHWVVSRYDDVDHVLSKYEDFSSIHQTIPKATTPFQLPPSEYDPPMHHEFRKVISPFFTPKSISDLEQRARELTVALIDKFYDKGACDFAKDFSLHMPIGIFMSIADLPAADREYLLDLGDRIVRPQSPADRFKAFEDMFAYLDKVFEERAKNPGNDVLSAMTTARIDGGRPMTKQEMLGMGALMVAAGLDTVASTMSFITLFLARNPAHRRRLTENPEIIPKAVEELLRVHGVANLSRMVTHDLTYKGVFMKAGDMVLTGQSSAGFDERHYPEPTTVDFTRADKKHVVFGRGQHQCIGAFLARTELRVFLAEWLKRIPDFDLAPGAVALSRPGPANACLSLPIVWEVRR